MPYASIVSSVKETLAVTRELVIVLALAVVIAKPVMVARWAGTFNDEAKKVGAKSTGINIGGLATIAFDNAVAQVAVLETARQGVEKLAQEAARDPRQAKIGQQAALIESTMAKGIAAAKTELLGQDQVLQDAPRLATGDGTYGIVVSADKENGPAAFEVQQLRNRKISDVAVYARQGFLRTVARFDAKDSADKELATLRAYRKTAYVINLDKWCPRARSLPHSIAGAPVLECE